MLVDSQTLRDTLRFWGTGVTIVTTAAETAQDRQTAGMTVSTFNSLSLEPAQILVCLAKASVTTDLILTSRIMAVSILSSEQAYLSDRFSGRLALAPGEDRFDGVPITTAVTGAPILRDALAWLDCRVTAVHDGSTHWIVVGEVTAAGHGDDSAAPLIHFNRAYHVLTPEGERS